MAAYHSDEILDVAALPLRYAAFSPCFRKEAGSHGKDTKGIIRVHWFDKVEMFVYTTVEDSYAEHQRLLEWEKEFLDKLELAYRVIDVAAGDLGLSAPAQVRLRGVDPHPGQVPRAHLDLELHRLPDPSARHPGRFPRRDGCPASEADRHPQRHAVRDDRARSSRSWRPTSRPTARSRVPAGAAALARRARGPGAVGVVADRLDPPSRLDRRGLAAPARRPRHRRHPAEVGRGRGREHEEIPPAVYDAVHRARDAGAHVVLASGRSPHGMTPDRRPARPARRRSRPAVGGRLQRRRGLPLPAAGGRPRGDLRRPPAVAAVLRASPERAGRGRGARASATGSTGTSPTGELSGEMIHRRRRRPRRRAGQPGDHPRPRRDRRRLRRARRAARPARHRLRRRLDRLARPLARGRLQGVAAGVRRRRARASTRPTCWPSATAATTSRCCAGPAAGWRWARPSTRSIAAADAVTASVHDDGAAIEIARWFPDG